MCSGHQLLPRATAVDPEEHGSFLVVVECGREDAKMAGALLQFMKTGDPNAPGFPEWPKYSANKGQTMI
jgi:hypothetical protein